MGRGKYKGPKRGAGQRARGMSGVGGAVDPDAEDEFRKGSVQQPNAGKMPSDSDSEEEEKPAKPTLNMFAGMGAPGELPPNSSDEDGTSSSDDDDVQPHGAPAAAAPPPRKKKADNAVDPADIAKDMERLKLIKEKREQQRQERIAAEGWDRFAPVTETNKPPDGRPADHPDFRK